MSVFCVEVVAVVIVVKVVLEGLGLFLGIAWAALDCFGNVAVVAWWRGGGGGGLGLAAAVTNVLPTAWVVSGDDGGGGGGDGGVKVVVMALHSGGGGGLRVAWDGGDERCRDVPQDTCPACPGVPRRRTILRA